MTRTVVLDVSGIGGLIQTLNSGNLFPGADGTITVDASDVPSLLRMGAQYVKSTSNWQNITPAPRAGSAGRIVASAAFAAGTLSIANQPDVPRRLAVKVDPGTSAITAGNIALAYTGNDGQATTDNISAITAASQILTAFSSKGVAHVTSVIVTGVTGGTSPGVQVDDTNFLGLGVSKGFGDFSVYRASVDGANETIGSVVASAGVISPNTAPNSTHTYGFGYTYQSPNS